MSAPSPEELNAFMLTALKLYGSQPQPRVELSSPLKSGSHLVVVVFTVPAPADPLPDNIEAFPNPTKI